MRRGRAAYLLAAWVLGCGAPPRGPASEAADVPPDPSPQRAGEAVRDAAVPPPAVERTSAPKPIDPPPGLVDLERAVPALRLSIGYATHDNFTGAPLPGYDVAAAWAHPALAAALVEVDRALEPDGLGLLVYDAYRPRRATAAMVTWTRRTHRTDLLRDGYIAARSQHNRGLAVDLTLTARDSGEPLPMGGAWDTFGPSSGAFAAKGEADANRRALRHVMTRHGFMPHDGEWWHFSIRHGDAPAQDVPYAAAEG